MAVTYLFTRYRFNWNEVAYSIFSTYNMLTGLVGVIFCVGVLSHKLKIDDALVGVISSMSKILSGFVYAFATVPWHMYAGAIVETFNGTSFIAMRSIATKLVDKSELGKVNSLFGVAEALMPMVFAPMYTTLYAATLKVLPGAFFLLGSAFTVLAVIIFLWMYNFQRKFNAQNAALKAAELEKGNADNPKMVNGNLQTIEAIALEMEAKGKPNGIVTNVIQQTLEKLESDVNTVQQNVENTEKNTEKDSNGVENHAYQPDV